MCDDIITSSVDATEPNNTKGRLVQFGEIGNAVVRVIADRGVPHLCIFASAHIAADDQIIIGDVSWMMKVGSLTYVIT